MTERKKAEIEPLFHRKRHLESRRFLINDMHAIGQFYANYEDIMVRINAELVELNKQISTLLKEEHGYDE